METHKKINIDTETIQKGAKVIGRTLVGIGRVITAVAVTAIEILHDVVKDKGKVE